MKFLGLLAGLRAWAKRATEFVLEVWIAKQLEIKQVLELMFINVNNCDHGIHPLPNHRLCPFHNWHIMSINLVFHSY